MSQILIAALYKFVALPDYVERREQIRQKCLDAGLTGTILLAQEGINGTIAGLPDRVHEVLAFLRSSPEFVDLSHKESFALEMPFKRMKVRLKREIVTMGKPGVDPNKSVGTYVAPQDWNALISDPDVAVIDTRNDYEVALGSFANAINPQTSSFRDFPNWFERSDVLEGKSRVAMFCTGGIRCEKATAYLRDLGLQEIYHLEGGILKYLEEVPEQDSLWHGECFVFDDRITVNHRLEPGEFAGDNSIENQKAVLIQSEPEKP